MTLIIGWDPGPSFPFHELGKVKFWNLCHPLGFGWRIMSLCSSWRYSEGLLHAKHCASPDRGWFHLSSQQPRQMCHCRVGPEAGRLATPPGSTLASLGARPSPWTRTGVHTGMPSCLPGNWGWLGRPWLPREPGRKLLCDIAQGSANSARDVTRFSWRTPAHYSVDCRSSFLPLPSPHFALTVASGFPPLAHHPLSPSHCYNHNHNLIMRIKRIQRESNC